MTPYELLDELLKVIRTQLKRWGNSPSYTAALKAAEVALVALKRFW